MILMREKCTSSRSRDRHGLFFMNKQRMCVWALNKVTVVVDIMQTPSNGFKGSKLSILECVISENWLKPHSNSINVVSL